MEPMLPTPEQPSRHSDRGESLDSSIDASIEAQQGFAAERVADPQLGVAASQQAADGVQITVASTPTASDVVGAAVVDESVAMTDADEIEKEWVDKARKIVSETRTDPHKQEEEVGKLQLDYLMKRHGKQIKSAG